MVDHDSQSAKDADKFLINNSETVHHQQFIWFLSGFIYCCSTAFIWSRRLALHYYFYTIYVEDETRPFQFTVFYRSLVLVSRVSCLVCRFVCLQASLPHCLTASPTPCQSLCPPTALELAGGDPLSLSLISRGNYKNTNLTELTQTNRTKLILNHLKNLFLSLHFSIQRTSPPVHHHRYSVALMLSCPVSMILSQYDCTPPSRLLSYTSMQQTLSSCFTPFPSPFISMQDQLFLYFRIYMLS